jgi:nucleotide-binding universal stress UspA family protein
VLDLGDSVEALASLYAIGVVGAIVLDIGSCAFARTLPLSRGQRRVMKLTVTLLAAIWVTIALSKLYALLFVVIVLAVGLAIREHTHRQRRHAAQPTTLPAPVPGAAAGPAADRAPFLGQSILAAARGWTPALQFALEESRVRGAHLLVLYVREVAVNIDMSSNWQDDPDARVLFNRLESEATGLKVNKLYSVSDSPADTIIDIAATFGVDTVVLGGSRRATLVNLLKGNVVARVAAHLPESMHLIVIG